MSRLVRALTVLAVVAACVAIPASAVVESIDRAPLAGVTNLRLSNNADNVFPVDTSGGQQHGTIYTRPTLTDGTFRIQGASSMYPISTAPTGLVRLLNMTVSNGNVVISGYYPVVTLLHFFGMSGTVAANTPMITLTHAMSSDRLRIEVTDSSVAWGAAETVANTQILFLMPPRLSNAAGVFTLGVELTGASSVVSIPSTSRTSMVITNNSVVAVDYVKCNGCANGIVYAPTASISVESRSLLRVSHITFTSTSASASPVAIISAASGSIIPVNDSFIVVENITSRTSNVFSGIVDTTNIGTGGVVVRYVDVNAVGSTLGAGASYTDVAVQSGSDSLNGATHVQNACPAACLNGFSLENARLSCNCSCGSSSATPTPPPSAAVRTYHRNFCTLMSDPLSSYIPRGCMDGCIWCHNSTTCNACAAGYTLVNGRCIPSSPACNVPNCLKCVANDPNTCLYCREGYATREGQCVPLAVCRVANCAQCMLFDGTMCSTCQNGYILSNLYTCHSQHIIVNGAVTQHTLWAAVAVLVAAAVTYVA